MSTKVVRGCGSEGLIPLESNSWLTRGSFLGRRVVSRDNKGNSVKRLGLVVAVLVLAGCGMRLGPINKPPAPTGLAPPSRVTVTRVPSIMGWPVPMVFTIDGVETYGLWHGGRYTFMLEPGDYIFGYYLGFNECRQDTRIENKPSQLFHLGPPCRIRPAGY